MKLTKEECLEALDHIWYNGNEKEFELLEQLIEEHFESSLTREKLEKALDKACDYLTYLSNQTEEVVFEDGATNTDKEFWKEYLFDETN